MQASTFTYEDHAGVEIFVRKWDVDPGKERKGIVQIAHGLAEHSARYEHVAKTLTDDGFAVYADDHRGHGKTAGDLDKSGILGPGGWDGTVKAIRNLTEYIRNDMENEDLPLFLLGHSWGSYMSQQYIQKWGNTIDGVILSGTNGKQPMLGILKILSKMIVFFKGTESKATFIDKLAMKPMNDPFKPSRTPFDWLTRDEDVVDEYVEDPWCGFVMSNGFFKEMAIALGKMWKKENEEKIPKDLPIYMFSGEKDPTNNMAEGFMELYHRYEDLGIEDLSYKIYDGARHETLNETNRDEVKQDFLDWLNNHI